MKPRSYFGLDEITFRMFLPWYLFEIGSLVIVGALGLTFGVRQGGIWHWAGVLCAGAAGLLTLLVVLRYHACSVSLRGTDLIVRTGLLVAREYPVSVFQAQLELDQGLAARLFDYATVTLTAGRREITIPMIASAQTLRFVVAERRALIDQFAGRLARLAIGLDPHTIDPAELRALARQLPRSRSKVPREASVASPAWRDPQGGGHGQASRAAAGTVRRARSAERGDPPRALRGAAIAHYNAAQLRRAWL